MPEELGLRCPSQAPTHRILSLSPGYNVCCASDLDKQTATSNVAWRRKEVPWRRLATQWRRAKCSRDEDGFVTQMPSSERGLCLQDKLAPA